MSPVPPRRLVTVSTEVAGIDRPEVLDGRPDRKVKDASNTCIFGDYIYSSIDLTRAHAWDFTSPFRLPRTHIGSSNITTREASRTFLFITNVVFVEAKASSCRQPKTINNITLKLYTCTRKRSDNPPRHRRPGDLQRRGASR